ncbi:MAG: pilin [Patescibacteria group bacterium]|nr:pilin [Patescibacteria group bacterium]
MKKIIFPIIVVFFFLSTGFETVLALKCEGNCRKGGCFDGEVQSSLVDANCLRNDGSGADEICCVKKSGPPNPSTLDYERSPGNAVPTIEKPSAGITNPITANSFSELFQRAMNYFRTIAGTIAVLFIVIGGVMYMVSGANKTVTERAKKTIVFAIVGLVIVTAAPLFLSDIQLILKGGGATGTSALMKVALNVLRLLLSIVGILGIIGLIIGAVWMFTSAGDEDRLTMGKNAAKYAIIGIVLAAGSLVIIKQVMALITG